MRGVTVELIDNIDELRADERAAVDAWMEQEGIIPDDVAFILGARIKGSASRADGTQADASEFAEALRAAMDWQGVAHVPVHDGVHNDGTDWHLFVVVNR